MVVVVQTPIHTPTRTHTCSHTHTHTHTQGAGRRCLEGASPGGLGSSCPRLCNEPQAWHQATSGRHSARQVTSRGKGSVHPRYRMYAGFRTDAVQIPYGRRTDAVRTYGGCTPGYRTDIVRISYRYGDRSPLTCEPAGMFLATCA